MSAVDIIALIAAGVGCVVIGVVLHAVLRSLWECLCDWLRIKRFVWMTQGDNSCITEEELDDLSFNEARDWWKHHERERVWCRYDDFRAGMMAASKAILRQRGIRVVKTGKPRKATPQTAKEKGRP